MKGASAGPARRRRLTVAIVALDEQENLPRCLASVKFADEILVVDGGSTDGSRETARRYGARVVENASAGYARQRARALVEATGPWILFLDADEEASPELAEEIVALLASEPRRAGYEVTFCTFYLGRRFGSRGWHRDRALRLVLRERATVREAAVHESVRVDGPVGCLRSAVWHYSYRDVGHHMRKMARYAELKARDMAAQGRRTSLAGAVGHSAWRFLSGYVFQGGFLYGWPGLVWDLLGAHGTLLAYLKLLEIQHGRVPTAAGKR